MDVMNDKRKSTRGLGILTVALALSVWTGTQTSSAQAQTSRERVLAPPPTCVELTNALLPAKLRNKSLIGENLRIQSANGSAGATSTRTWDLKDLKLRYNKRAIDAQQVTPLVTIDNPSPSLDIDDGIERVARFQIHEGDDNNQRVLRTFFTGNPQHASNQGSRRDSKAAEDLNFERIDIVQTLPGSQLPTREGTPGVRSANPAKCLLERSLSWRPSSRDPKAKLSVGFDQSLCSDLVRIEKDLQNSSAGRVQRLASDVDLSLKQTIGNLATTYNISTSQVELPLGLRALSGRLQSAMDQRAAQFAMKTAIDENCQFLSRIEYETPSSRGATSATRRGPAN